MPILDVELVLAPGETPVSDLAGRLADAAGEVLGTEARRTWVKLRFIEANLYAENGGAAEGMYPVFVTVHKARVPAPDELRDEVGRLTRALAGVCDRPPEHVHVLYQHEGNGRVAFGGTLVG
jgi:phenylpyruvate tautomerase PptA (4-oxalocrotonate tautomerase family)